MDKRQEYIRHLREELDSIDAGLASLEAELMKASAEGQRELNTLRAQRVKVTDKLHELRKGGGSAWQDISQGAERAALELRRAISNARKRLSG